MARAISSLPVPVSPVMRTVESIGATLATRDSTGAHGGRRADDFLEHRGPIDFFSQRDVFMLEPLFQNVDLFQGFTERSCGMVAFRDVHGRPDIFDERPRIAENGVGQIVDMPERTVGANDAILGFVIGPPVGRSVESLPDALPILRVDHLQKRFMRRRRSRRFQAEDAQKFL